MEHNEKKLHRILVKKLPGLTEGGGGLRLEDDLDILPT